MRAYAPKFLTASQFFRPVRKKIAGAAHRIVPIFGSFPAGFTPFSCESEHVVSARGIFVAMATISGRGSHELRVRPMIIAQKLAGTDADDFEVAGRSNHYHPVDDHPLQDRTRQRFH